MRTRCGWGIAGEELVVHGAWGGASFDIGVVFVRSKEGVRSSFSWVGVGCM